MQVLIVLSTLVAVLSAYSTTEYCPNADAILPCVDDACSSSDQSCVSVESGGTGTCCLTTNVVAFTTTTVATTKVTTAAASKTTTSSTSCVDKVNPLTGVSDCPKSAYLCNNSAYYTMMTQQCPKTCGRCTSSSGSSSSSTCVDLVNPNTGVSDCPKTAYLCNDTTYYAVMTQQCPKTCGRCTSSGSSSSSGTTTASSSTTCADKTNPTTGTSDCPARAYLCNNTAYKSFMTVQCPKTCGRC